MTVLITGASGFIGTNLCEFLASKGIAFKKFKGDISNLDHVIRELHGVDTVIHLAALTYPPASYDTPDPFFRVNTIGTLNLLKARRMYKYLIHISTSHIYGRQEKFPITEDATPNPLDPYACSKLAAEQLVKIYMETYGLEAAIIRPFNNYGPYQKLQFFIPSIIMRALNNEPAIVYGDSMRDYVFVEDTCEILLKILDKKITGTYNICSGKCYKVSEIAKLIYKLLEKDDKVEVKPQTINRPNDIPIRK